MLTESQFHQHADATLTQLFEQLEEAFERHALEDLELSGGILTITLADNRTFIVNKHAASGELWLASPISGGHHFVYDESSATWMNVQGNSLLILLAQELLQAGSITMKELRS
jgi:iron donor protein CyaY